MSFRTSSRAWRDDSFMNINTCLAKIYRTSQFHHILVGTHNVRNREIAPLGHDLYGINLRRWIRRARDAENKRVAWHEKFIFYRQMIC